MSQRQLVVYGCILRREKVTNAVKMADKNGLAFAGYKASQRKREDNEKKRRIHKKDTKDTGSFAVPGTPCRLRGIRR